VTHACPVCRKEPFKIFPQVEADREIKALKVYCPNKNAASCGWTGELGSIVGYKLPQKCKKCDKCNDAIHYTVTSSHVTTECPCYCQYCDVTAERDMISKQHKEKCYKFPLQCPNDCGMDNIPRGNMDEHKKVCPLEMIQCEYHCGAVITRNEVGNHNKEKMIEHVQLSYQKNVTNLLSELCNDLSEQVMRSVQITRSEQIGHNRSIGSYLITVMLCVS